MIFVFLRRHQTRGPCIRGFRPVCLFMSFCTRPAYLRRSFVASLTICSLKLRSSSSTVLQPKSTPRVLQSGRGHQPTELPGEGDSFTNNLQCYEKFSPCCWQSRHSLVETIASNLRCFYRNKFYTMVEYTITPSGCGNVLST